MHRITGRLQFLRAVALVGTFGAMILVGPGARAASIIISRIYAYDGLQTSTILDSRSSILNVDVAGSRIVWQQSGTGLSQVYMHSDGQTTQLGDPSQSRFGPHVSETHVLYSGIVDGTVQLFLNDGVSTSQITNNALIKDNVKLSGDTALWMMGGDVYTYRNGETRQLTHSTPTFHVSQPSISDSRVAWVGQEQGTDSEIYLFDGANTSQISDNNVNDGFPDVSDSLLVWARISDPDADLMLYDGIQTAQIWPKGNGDVALLHDRVAWSTGPGGVNDIYLYQNGNIERIIETPAYDVRPSLSQTWLAWQTLNPANLKTVAIQVYDGSSVFSLPSSPDMQGPIASDDLIVTWESYQIPEPSSFFLAIGIAIIMGAAKFASSRKKVAGTG